MYVCIHNILQICMLTSRTRDVIINDVTQKMVILVIVQFLFIVFFQRPCFWIPLEIFRHNDSFLNFYILQFIFFTTSFFNPATNSFYNRRYDVMNKLRHTRFWLVTGDQVIARSFFYWLHSPEPASTKQNYTKLTSTPHI